MIYSFSLKEQRSYEESKIKTVQGGVLIQRKMYTVVLILIVLHGGKSSFFSDCRSGWRGRLDNHG